MSLASDRRCEWVKFGPEGLLVFGPAEAAEAVELPARDQKKASETASGVLEPTSMGNVMQLKLNSLPIHC